MTYRNCTESVQAMLRIDSDFEDRSRIFNYAWLLGKVMTIVSGLDTKVNLRVSLHDVILNLVLLKQQSYESNDGYLTKFKSMVEL